MQRVNLRTVEVWTFVFGLALLAFVLTANGCGDKRLTGWTQWGGDAARTGLC
ncbi:MAG: hypothetical protein ABI333_03795 [bacterium]